MKFATVRKTSRLAWALGVATLAVVLTACGGGGGGGATSVSGGTQGETSSGGTNTGTLNNKITVTRGTLQAGTIIEAIANTSMRGVTPKSMRWSILPMFVAPVNAVAPAIADPQCVNASFTAPPFATSQGIGQCKVAISASSNTASGVWRLTNVATSPNGDSVSDSIDIVVQAMDTTSSGRFRLLSSSYPLVASVGTAVSMQVPFVARDGAVVSSVEYNWSAAADNPSAPYIAGQKNSVATVTPMKDGQYQFTVTASAKVDGRLETSSATVVLVVTPVVSQDVLVITQPQIAAPGEIVPLNVTVDTPTQNAGYVYQWEQLPEYAGGGPVRVEFSSQTAKSVTVRAPVVLGTYVFEVTVTRRLPDGAGTTVAKARTSVIVEPAAAPVFVLDTGAAQVVTVGSVVNLAGHVTAQGASAQVSYSYLWQQMGAAPETVVISNAQFSSASFIPTVEGTYNFLLRVIARSGGTSTEVNSVTQVVVKPSSSTQTGNLFAMSASAGAVQTAAPNVVVNLYGDKTVQGATAGVVYTYRWTQQGMSPALVMLSNAGSQAASFFPTEDGTYTFLFTVTATSPSGTVRTATATTQVVVGPEGGTSGGFTVSAGNAQTGRVGVPVIMAGTVQTQGVFANAIYDYAWGQSGSTPVAVKLSNASTLTASFIPTQPGLYEFMLAVSANRGGVEIRQAAFKQVLVEP